MYQQNRDAQQSRRTLEKVQRNAVHVARVPGSQKVGVAGNEVPVLTSVVTQDTIPDADDNTLDLFIYGVDNPRTDPVYVLEGHPTRVLEFGN